MTAIVATFVRPGDGRIRLYLDSAERAQWDEWLATGLFFGVTIDPAGLSAAGVSCTLPALTDLAGAALAHGIHEVHVQTWGSNADEMFEHGKAFAAINHRVIVNVPITREGVAAVRRLRSRDIVTSFTALSSPQQALTAALVGVDYAAVDVGRITDSGRAGTAEVIAMHTILTRLGSSTRLLVAGIPSADEIGRLAQAGLDTYSLTAAVAAELFADAGTLGAVAASAAAFRG